MKTTTKSTQPKSRRPEAKKARRVIRTFLYVATLAADETQDADVREYATKRAESLLPKFEQATKLTVKTEA